MFGIVSFFLQVMVPVTILAHKLPRKSHFPLRAAGCAAGSYFLFWAVRQLLSLSGLFPHTGPGVNFSLETAAVVLIVLSIVSVWLCFDCTVTAAILFGSCGYALQNCIYYLKRIVMMFFSIDHDLYDERMVVIVFSLSYAAFFCLYHWVVRIGRTGDIQSRFAVIFPLSVILINIVMSSYIPWSDDTMLYCLYAFFLSLCLIIIQMGAFNISAANLEKRMLRQMIESERRQYKVHEETIHMIDLKCHNIKQEISVLLSEENTDLKHEEVEKIKNLVDIHGTFLKTGSSTLDVILSEKSLICGKNQILFTCMADGRLLDFMDITDICILLGNALDNAIESAVKIPDPEKRFINMAIVRREAFVSIHIENACHTTPQFSQGELVSDKRDAPGFHGYGVKSMRMVTEQYGGNITLQKQEDIFYLDILLPLPEQAE